MATTDKEQMSVAVPQHKRIAMGAKLDGSSMQSKGEAPAPTRSGGRPRGGALSQARNK